MKRRSFERLVLILFLIIGTSSAISAERSKTKWQHFHSNHIAVFSGVTSNDHGAEPTVGLEFERRLAYVHGMFGLGGFIERVVAEETANLSGISLLIHPLGRLKANFTVGVETVAAHSETLYRAGLAYDFHVDKISVSPTYNFDSIAGHTANVFGVAFGMGF